MSADKAEALGDLPEWDLSDLYAGPRLAGAGGRSGRERGRPAKAFKARYQGQLATLDGR